jgi:hypothetical protein
MTGVRWMLTAVVLLLAVPTGLFAQNYREAFVRGIQAFDQGNWKEAAAQFQAAAQLQPDSNENVRITGQRFVRYLPQYFLGQALFNLGDYQGALRALQASEQRGFVKNNANFYRTLQDRLKDAQSRTQIAAATTTVPPATTTVPVKPTTVPTTTIAGRGTPPSTTTAIQQPAGPSPEAIKAAEAALALAVKQRQAFEAVADLAFLRQMNANVSAQETTARNALDQATARLETGRKGNLNDLGQVRTLSQASVTAYQRGQQLAGEARKRVLSELTGAANLYFGGQYTAAQTALNQLNYQQGRYAVQWRLFRAATAYSLYIVSGQRDEALQKEAAANVRECRRLAASFKPDTGVFSPKFVQFFEATR